MDLLIIGGTVFLGRALVEAAQTKGHQVTLFNRGRSNPDLFPEIERLTGDRKESLEALDGRKWDAAIDTSGYIPRVVQMSASKLAAQCDHYTFISSLSVYPDHIEAGADEGTPVATLPDETIEEVTGETYGPLKALSEQAAETAMPGRVLVVRPGLIVGPYDASDRFTYWPYRVAQGGEVLAPGRPKRGIQIIDVRDLAEWTLRMIETRETGVYNATSPAGMFSMGDVLYTCKEVSQSNADFTWLSEEFLLEHEVGPWMEMPLWIPESQAEYRGFYEVHVSRALANGLSFRPLSDTVWATLAWASTRPSDHTWRAGMKKEREEELLRLWKTVTLCG